MSSWISFGRGVEWLLEELLTFEHWATYLPLFLFLINHLLWRKLHLHFFFLSSRLRRNCYNHLPWSYFSVNDSINQNISTWCFSLLVAPRARTRASALWALQYHTGCCVTQWHGISGGVRRCSNISPSTGVVASSGNQTDLCVSIKRLLLSQSIIVVVF